MEKLLSGDGGQVGAGVFFGGKVINGHSGTGLYLEF